MAENGVISVNRFDLLDDEPRKTKKTPKPQSAAPAPERRNDRDRSDNRRNGGHGRGRGRSGRGRGGRQGGRRDDPTRERRGVRDYDRRSGTGRGNRVGRQENKGNNKFDWGGDGTDEFKKNPEGIAEPVKETTTDTPVADETAEKTEAVVEENQEPPEPETKTYDQFMEEKRKAFVAVDISIRATANDEFKGKSVKSVKAAEKADLVVMAEITKGKKKNRKKGSGRSVPLSIDQFAAPPTSDRSRGRDDRGPRGRGGRGRDRGNRGDRYQGRGGNRGGNNRQSQNAPVLADQSSFPSLGA